MIRCVSFAVTSFLHAVVDLLKCISFTFKLSKVTYRVGYVFNVPSALFRCHSKSLSLLTSEQVHNLSLLSNWWQKVRRWCTTFLRQYHWLISLLGYVFNSGCLKNTKQLTRAHFGPGLWPGPSLIVEKGLLYCDWTNTNKCQVPSQKAARTTTRHPFWEQAEETQYQARKERTLHWTTGFSVAPKPLWLLLTLTLNQGGHTIS